MTDHSTRRPSPYPPGLSGKTSPIVLLFGLVLLAAGITLICLGLKRSSEKDLPAAKPGQHPKPALTAPQSPEQPDRGPGKP